MGAPVRVEDEAFSDPRIALLGEIAGYNAFEALGRMTHLWRVCTHKQTYYATEITVKACLGPNGVAALIGSELGEIENGIIRVRGTEGRIEWLGKRRAASAAGGDAKRAKSEAKAASAEAKTSKREAKRKPNGSQTEAKLDFQEAKPEPNRSPLTPTPSLSTSQTTEGETASPPVAVAEPSSEPKPPSPHKQVMNAWDDAFSAAHDGEMPSWGRDELSAARTVLDKAKGRVEEVRRRIRILYTAPPDWLKPPYDIYTLKHNFDKLVAPSAPTTGRREIERPGRPLETLK